LRQAIGEFILTHRNMKCKSRGSVYSINEGYAKDWSKGIAEYIKSKKYPPVSWRKVQKVVVLGGEESLWPTVCRLDGGGRASHFAQRRHLPLPGDRVFAERKGKNRERV
jgi:hypothetical protein